MALEIIVGALAAIAAVLFLLVLFEPSLGYHLQAPPPAPASAAFRTMLAANTGSELRGAAAVDVLTDGAAFYEAELAAIGAAQKSVHIEAFIFHPSAVGDRFLAALAERAEAGVAVRIIVDAIGSFPTPDRYFAPLRAAGGCAAWYQPIRWYTLKRFNNRTHREIIVVDSTIGFVGGAGIASHWLGRKHGKPPWRDTMLRVTGPLVAGLQTAFAENWLEATGEILGEAAVVHANAADRAPGLVVIGTPSPARSSPVRVLFQLLLAGARESIDINSPYFLPDPSARRELIAAVDRGVRVRVITPGRSNNHPIARLASRRRYGELLDAGVEIHEYQPGMIHAKILIVDGLWSAVGSTNFDSRSFALNDEINLAVADRSLAARLTADFEHDRAQSLRITRSEWQRRPLHEKTLAMLGMLLERQE
jgi:cardiolipin synthase